ncbi:MAG: phosphate acyltransferase PlsX [Pseudomonadota bacterium]
MTTLAIDAMGGDAGLEATVPATCEAALQQPDVNFILVGIESDIESALSDANRTSLENVSIQHASEVVEMQDAPAFALRKKKDSSMRVAINLVKDGAADACVSSGNTGALMATAKFVLNTIAGIERPAICAALPRIHGQTYMLDLGANVDSPATILYQFGVMGALLIECLEDKSSPSIGLLNIGTEDLKGNDTIKAAAALFRESDLNYAGFAEANEIYVGNKDLIVCDGFTGNIALKATEGAAEMIMAVMREEFSRNLMRKSSAVLASPVIRSIKNRLDHRRYNGASLLGLKGTVVKSHGGSDDLAFKAALNVAIEEVRNELVARIEAAMTAAMD